MRRSIYSAFVIVALVSGPVSCNKRHPVAAVPVPIPTVTPTPITVTWVGLLSAMHCEDCWIPEGCGPKFRLGDAHDLNAAYPYPAISQKPHIALMGDINYEHNGLIISVEGEEVDNIPTDYFCGSGYVGMINADTGEFVWVLPGNNGFVSVGSYSLLSSIPKQDCINIASEYIKQTYGCDFRWGGIFSWEMNGEQAIIKYRTINSHASEPYPFIEIWVDANTGDVINELNNLGGSNPCP